MASHGDKRSEISISKKPFKVSDGGLSAFANLLAFTSSSLKESRITRNNDVNNDSLSLIDQNTSKDPNAPAPFIPSTEWANIWSVKTSLPGASPSSPSSPTRKRESRRLTATRKRRQEETTNKFGGKRLKHTPSTILFDESKWKDMSVEERKQMIGPIVPQRIEMAKLKRYREKMTVKESEQNKESSLSPFINNSLTEDERRHIRLRRKERIQQMRTSLRQICTLLPGKTTDITTSTTTTTTDNSTSATQSTLNKLEYDPRNPYYDSQSRSNQNYSYLVQAYKTKLKQLKKKKELKKKKNKSKPTTAPAATTNNGSSSSQQPPPSFAPPLPTTTTTTSVDDMVAPSGENRLPIPSSSRASRFPSDWIVERRVNKSYYIRSPDGVVYNSIKEGLDGMKKTAANNVSFPADTPTEEPQQDDDYQLPSQNHNRSPKKSKLKKKKSKKSKKPAPVPIGIESPSTPLTPLWMEDGITPLLGSAPVWDDKIFVDEEGDLLTNVMISNRFSEPMEKEEGCSEKGGDGEDNFKSSSSWWWGEAKQHERDLEVGIAGAGGFGGGGSVRKDDGILLPGLGEEIVGPNGGSGTGGIGVGGVSGGGSGGSDVRTSGRARRSINRMVHCETGAALPSAVHAHALVVPKLYSPPTPTPLHSTLPREEDPPTQPFEVIIHPSALFFCDLHAHVAQVEIIGLLGGKWLPSSSTPSRLYVQACFPCVAADDGSTDVEIDPVSMTCAQSALNAHGMVVVGWYHSHPTFDAKPSSTDLINQANYQAMFRMDEKSAGGAFVEPFVGLIVHPPARAGGGSGKKPPKGISTTSELTWFHVHREATTYSSRSHSLARMGYSGVTLPGGDECAFAMMLHVTVRVRKGSVWDNLKREEVKKLNASEGELQLLRQKGTFSHLFPAYGWNADGGSAVVASERAGICLGERKPSVPRPKVIMTPKQVRKSMKDMLATLKRNRLHGYYCEKGFARGYEITLPEKEHASHSLATEISLLKTNIYNYYHAHTTDTPYPPTPDTIITIDPHPLFEMVKLRGNVSSRFCNVLSSRLLYCCEICGHTFEKSITPYDQFIAHISLHIDRRQLPPLKLIAPGAGGALTIARRIRAAIVTQALPLPETIVGRFRGVYPLPGSHAYMCVEYMEGMSLGASKKKPIELKSLGVYDDDLEAALVYDSWVRGGGDDAARGLSVVLNGERIDSEYEEEYVNFFMDGTRNEKAVGVPIYPLNLPRHRPSPYRCTFGEFNKWRLQSVGASGSGSSSVGSFRTETEAARGHNLISLKRGGASGDIMLNHVPMIVSEITAERNGVDMDELTRPLYEWGEEEKEKEVIDFLTLEMEGSDDGEEKDGEEKSETAVGEDVEEDKIENHSEKNSTESAAAADKSGTSSNIKQEVFTDESQISNGSKSKEPQLIDDTKQTVGDGAVPFFNNPKKVSCINDNNNTFDRMVKQQQHDIADEAKSVASIRGDKTDDEMVNNSQRVSDNLKKEPSNEKTNSSESKLSYDSNTRQHISNNTNHSIKVKIEPSTEDNNVDVMAPDETQRVQMSGSGDDVVVDNEPSLPDSKNKQTSREDNDNSNPVVFVGDYRMSKKVKREWLTEESKTDTMDVDSSQILENKESSMEYTMSMEKSKNAIDEVENRSDAMDVENSPDCEKVKKDIDAATTHDTQFQEESNENSMNKSNVQSNNNTSKNDKDNQISSRSSSDKQNRRRSRSSDSNNKNVPQSNVDNQNNKITPEIIFLSQIFFKAASNVTTRLERSKIPSYLSLVYDYVRSEESKTPKNRKDKHGKSQTLTSSCSRIPALRCAACDCVVLDSESIVSCSKQAEPLSLERAIEILEKHLTSSLHCLSISMLPLSVNASSSSSSMLLRQSIELLPKELSTSLEQLLSSHPSFSLHDRNNCSPKSTVCICRHPSPFVTGVLSTGPLVACYLSQSICNGYFHPTCCEGGYYLTSTSTDSTDKEEPERRTTRLSCAECAKLYSSQHPDASFKTLGDSFEETLVSLSTTSLKKKTDMTWCFPSSLQSSKKSGKKNSRPVVVFPTMLSESPEMNGILSQIQSIVLYYYNWPSTRRRDLLLRETGVDGNGCNSPLNAMNNINHVGEVTSLGEKRNKKKKKKRKRKKKMVDECDRMRMALAPHIAKMMDDDGDLLDYICRYLRFAWGFPWHEEEGVEDEGEEDHILDEDDDEWARETKNKARNGTDGPGVGGIKDLVIEGKTAFATSSKNDDADDGTSASKDSIADLF